MVGLQYVSLGFGTITALHTQKQVLMSNTEIATNVQTKR